MPIIFVLHKCLGISGSNHCFPMVAFEPCPLLLSFENSRMTTVLESESHSTESFQVSGKVSSLHMFYQQNISLELSDPIWYEIFHRWHSSSGKQWGQVKAPPRKRHTGIEIQAQCYFKEENKEKKENIV